MSRTSGAEAFPAVSQQRTYLVRPEGSPRSDGPVRPRPKSSSLGGDPRGDTGVGSLATRNELSPSPPSLGRTASERADKLARPHSKRRKAKSLLQRWARLSLRNTWLTPLALTLLILALYAMHPTESNPLHSAIFLSYPLPPDHTFPPIKDVPRPATPPPTRQQYGKGPRDLAFVAFYTVVLSFTREFLMQCAIRPAAAALGIHSRGKQARFMEQMYTACYFGVFGPLGLVVMARTPVWYFNTTGMYEGFPHRAHEALFKAYYLLQAAYWAQQALVLVLALEKPRKDFRELVLHHIITLALIALSYTFHFTYMGLAVYITHDISDFFLATSKSLNYLDSALTGPYFAVFMFVWGYLRHYINLRILYSVLTEFRSVGPWVLDWETQQYKCWVSGVITFALLAALQAVNAFWSVLVLRIAWRFVRRSGLADMRSEDEDEETEAEGAPEVRGNGALGVPLTGRPEGTMTGKDVGGLGQRKGRAGSQ